MFYKTKKGSAILMTLLILGVVLVTALSVALVTLQELKGSRGASRTTATYQTADEGIEAVMYDIMKSGKSTVSQLDNCQSDGTIGGESLGYQVALLDKNENPIACNDSGVPISDVKKIKSVGTLGSDNQRSVVASIPLSCNGNTDDEDTKLLLHFDGGSDGESFIDASSEEHDISKHGDVEISSEEKKFCKSAKFDGSGDYLSVSDSNDWDFGDKNFTIEFWVYVDSSSTNKHKDMFFQTDSVFSWNNFIMFQIDSNNHLRFKAVSAGSTVIDYWTGISVPTDTFTHVAGVRDGSNFYFFVNGEKKGTYSGISGNMPDCSGKITIGYPSDGNADYFRGYLDEFRISKGIARWTDDFVPPTYPY